MSIDKLLEEKLRWEAEAEHGSDEPEPEYDPEERMDALEVLLAHINGAVRLIDKYSRGSHEEQTVAYEAGQLKKDLEEYGQKFEALYREAEQDYADNN